MANVSFPGGGSGAATGVGGMNGARNILKIADAEQQQRRAGANDGAKVGVGRAKASGDSSMLHPISIHVVPRSESRSITLIAVTGGGLRLYLSALTLSTSTIEAGAPHLLDLENDLLSSMSVHRRHILPERGVTSSWTRMVAPWPR